MAWAPLFGASYGDAERGAELVRSQQCTTCHPIAGSGGAGAPDLAHRSTKEFTSANLAAKLWNHGPNMWNAMTSREAVLRRAGRRGRRIFAAKNCGQCHGQAGSAAPQLTQRAGDYTAPQLASAVRRHGPTMLEEMKASNIDWPQFKGQEMADLIACLNSP